MKNGIKKFTCVGCGKSVEKSCLKGAKYCSTDCYHKNKPKVKNKKGVIKKCVVCGKEFYVPMCRTETAETCSVFCANEFQRRNKIEITCIQCGKKVKLSPSFKSQKYCSDRCRYDSEEFKQMLAENNAKNNKGHLNNFEKMAYALMNEMGINFTSQHIIGGKFTVDAFISSKNTVVQFDGDYWHGNKDMFPTPDHRQKKRMALDISQDAYMKACGINVIRVWQSEFKNIESVKSKLSILLD